MSQRKRKPRINPGRQGGAFDGVFDPAPSDLPPSTAETVSRADPPAPPPESMATGTVPQPGDPDYERTVQGNWNIPAWIRAKVRAIKDYDGTGQNETVQAALAMYIEELERKKGRPYPVQERHFR